LKNYKAGAQKNGPPFQAGRMISWFEA